MFKNSIPLDDTFAHLIAAIKPQEFQQCFIAWMRSFYNLTLGEVVAMDDITLRGSYNRDNQLNSIHMISTYASANQFVLKKTKINSTSNETTAILEHEGGYLLAVKEPEFSERILLAEFKLKINFRALM
ncbi:ISAs1 family transposase [Serratia fonticola]|uniref:ISAs1 family transposase n=1 Tax=Serratia fonticola TaxID=47917 RepID=A0AAJ1YHM9_SERFO|nr:ISAs1 family transposase [Serratia fonticola]